MTSKDVAIVGVGETDWSRESGRSTLTMATQACNAAIDDSGMDRSDIDGLLCFTEADSSPTQDVGSRLGLDVRFAADLFGGGGNPELMVAIAAAAVREGRCKAVLCYRSMNGRSGTRMGNAFATIPYPNSDWLVPAGCTSPAALFGLAARRQMHDLGMTREDLAAVAITFREHANRNPNAVMRDRKMTADDYFAAPWIVEPFGLFDCCLETDGAAALLITSAERVADSRNGGVLVRAVEARTAKRRGDFMQSEDITDVAGGRVAPNLFATAGCGPQDIEVAAIYDCFTYTVIAQLEAYGFCSRGEAGAFVREGHLKLDGRLPSNTAGGQLSEAYTHGMNNVIELVRQVRRDHEGTDRQAPNTDLGLCAGWVNPGVASAMILEAIR